MFNLIEWFKVQGHLLKYNKQFEINRNYKKLIVWNICTK